MKKALKVICFAIFALVLISQAGWAGTAEADAGQSNAEYEHFKRIADAFSLIERNFVEKPENRMLADGCINGMLTTLDARSGFITKEQMDQLRRSQCGVGITIVVKDGIPKVVTSLEGSSAYNNGIRSGDVIVALDSQSIIGRTHTQIVQQLFGRAGTMVTLSIVHAGDIAVKHYELERYADKQFAVEAKVVAPDIGYIRIKWFADQTVKETVTAVNRLLTEDKVSKGIILDLRNNPGGLLYSAIGVAGVFLDPALLIASTDGRAKNAQKKLYSKDYRKIHDGSDILASVNPVARQVKLFVFINQGTASGAEIVAGALKDHRRASILGQRSNGVGTIQAIYPQDNGSAIKLTVSRYLTPSGHQLETNGITPDVPIEVADNRYSSEDQFLEKALENIMAILDK